MQGTMRQRLGVFLVLLLVLAAAGCGSSVTQENYDKIKVGMERSEVREILGAPTSTSDVTIGPLSGTSATWKGGGNTVNVQFVNDKLATKELNAE